MYLIGAGFGLTGTSRALLVLVRTTFVVVALVGLRDLGTALVSLTLATLISKRGRTRRAGGARDPKCGQHLGQASGPLLGGALFIWQLNAPYLLTGTMLAAVALVIGWKAMDISQAHSGEKHELLYCQRARHVLRRCG